MIDVQDAERIQSAGYRPLREAQPGRPGVWLATRRTDAVPVILRVLESAEAFDLELHTRASRHVIAILEIFSIPSGRNVVVEEYAAGGQFSLRYSPSVFSPGEAVTALMPVLEELQDRVEANLLPAALTRGKLLIDASGRIRIANSARHVQLVQLRDGTSRDGAESAIRSVLNWLGAALPGWSECVARAAVSNRSELSTLMDWLALAASPVPIRDPLPQPIDGLPQRIGEATAWRTESGDPPERPDSLVEHVHTWFRQTFSRIIGKFHPVLRLRRRRSIVIAAGVMGTCLAAAVLALLPPDGAPSSLTEVRGEATPSAPNPLGLEASTPRASNGSDAVRQLLSNRAACRQSTASCLEGIDERGSALFAEDTSRLAQGASLRVAFVPIDEPKLISDLGAAALFSVRSEHTTASVLLMQTEAGWRIRDVFD